MYLTVTNLSHSFENKVLYENAGFRILPGDKIGVVGPNGVGKTTLIKILCEKLIPDEGKIEFNDKISVGYLDQYLDINQNQSIYDYLTTSFSSLYALNDELLKLTSLVDETVDEEKLLKLSTKINQIQEILTVKEFYLINTKINKIACGLGLNSIGLDHQISTLSGGQKIKVILAKLLLSNPDLLILDEPTNFLDSVHVEWLTKFLKEYGKTFLIVSHNQEFLNDVVNVILEIDHLKITRYKGNYQKYLEKKALERENIEKSYDRQQKQIAKLTDYVKKNIARASTSNSAKSRQKQLDKMNVIKINKSSEVKVNFSFNYVSLSSHKLLEITDLEIGYYGYSLLPKINFLCKSGEKIGITGFNGIGKSTLMKTLMGIIPPVKGNFKFTENAKLAYFSQEFEFNDKDITPVDYIRNFNPLMDNKEIRSKLALLGIRDQLALQKIANLSGGEQAKLRLCQLTLLKSNVLLLDEPTNHLDHNAKEGLKLAIKKYPGTVLIVTHEQEFLNGVVDRIFNIEDLLIE